MSADARRVDDIIDRAMHVLTGEAGPEENLDRELRWGLHAAQLELLNEVNPHSFRKTFTITTVTGQAEYALPDDFHAVIEDTVRRVEDSQIVREMPVQTYHMAQVAFANSSGSPDCYFIQGKSQTTGSWIMFFTPTPDADGEEIKGVYRSLPDVVWNSTRGSGQMVDLRFEDADLGYLHHGIIACGHFSRYLQGQDLVIHTKKWGDHIALRKKNNNPVVGKAYQRSPYPPKRMNIPGGVHPAWWGADITGP